MNCSASLDFYLFIYIFSSVGRETMLLHTQGDVSLLTLGGAVFPSQKSPLLGMQRFTVFLSDVYGGNHMTP